MNDFRMLGLVVAVAAASLTVFVSGATASKFTAPLGTTYTSSLNAQSGTTTISGSFVTVECKKSTISAKVEKHSGVIDAGGKISGLTLTECNFAVTVNKGGSFDVNSSGDVDLFDTEITIATSVGTCVFTADSSWLGGTEMGYLSEGVPGVIHFAPGQIPRTGGSAGFLCGSDGHWNASYTVTTPSSLWVD